MIASRHERRRTGAASALALLAGLAACAISLVVAQRLSPLTVVQGGAPVTVTANWVFEGLRAAYQAAAGGYPNVPILKAAFGMLAGFEALNITLVRSGLAWSARFHAAAGGLAGFVAFITTYMSAFGSAPIVDTREHVEGPRLVRAESGVKALKAMMKAEAGTAGFGFDLLPGVAISALRELRGVLICGATGSGKTRILLYLIDQILAAAKATPNRRIRLLVHDTTGEILEGFPTPDQTFAVLHGHRPGGWAWSMGRDVLSITDAEATADAFAPSTSEGIWGQGASTLLAAAQVKCQVEHGTSWSVSEFYDTLLEDPIVLKAVYEKIYPPAAALIEVDPESGALSKTTVSFLLTLRAAVLRHLRPLAEHWRSIPESKRFSIVEWLDDSNRGQPRFVILQRSAKYAELSAAWIGAMVDLAAAHATDESFPNSQKRRIFVALEELPTLGKLRSLPALLDVARNKGIGVIASVQEPEQLTIHYGELQAKSLMKRFRTRIVCQQTLDGDTEELAADLMGTRTVLVEQETRSTNEGAKTSRTVAKVEKEVPVVGSRHLAYELGVRGEKVRAIVAGFENPVEVDWPMTIWSTHRGRDMKPPSQKA